MLHSISYDIMLLRKDFIEYCNKRLHEIGLSQGLVFFIIYVGKYPGCSPRELAQGLRLDIGHTTRTITKLIQNGFLLQEVNEKDRRAHILQLTEAGREAFRISHELFLQWDEEMTTSFSTSEKEELLSLLNKLKFQKERS